MRNLIMLGCVLLLVGCGLKFPQTKSSELKEEQAEIVSMTYVPHRSSTDISPGISMSGDFVMSINSVSFPEVWAVGFRCEGHNKTFILDNKELYQHARIGDRVILKYVDEIRYFKEIPNSEEVIDQHTKQIIFKSGMVNR